MATNKEYRVMFRGAGLAGSIRGLVNVAYENGDDKISIALFIEDLLEMERAIKAYTGVKA